MRGESLEPGGCSLTPTSAWAAASAARPALVPPPVGPTPSSDVAAGEDALAGGDAPVDAPASAEEKLVACEAVAVAAGSAGAGESRVCSSAMRSSAATRDIVQVIGSRGASFN